MSLDNIEFIGEKIFLDEIGAAGVVWVARNVYQKVYAMELDETGLSLPVWSSRQRVVEFLRNARPIGPPYEPHSVPLGTFTNAWMSDRSMDITELQINPDGKATRVLCLTADEFKTTQGVQ